MTRFAEICWSNAIQSSRILSRTFPLTDFRNTYQNLNGNRLTRSSNKTTNWSCESLEICARTHWVPDPQYGTGSIFSRFTNLRLSSTGCIQITSWCNLKSTKDNALEKIQFKALFSLRNFLTNPSSQPCISGNRLESRYHAVPAKLKKAREISSYFPWSRSCWGLEDGENESRFEC